MDFVQVSRFFDRQDFDTYSTSTNLWTTKVFKGQVKIADKFVSIWNRATRRRMLYIPPEAETKLAPVIRVSSTQDTYMVGVSQKDVHDNLHYRSVVNVQHVLGEATVVRRAPVGPPNNPGWAVASTVYTSYADYELRSTSEDDNDNILNYGKFFLFMPRDVLLEREDLVTVGSKTFYVYETYMDSGLSCARASVEPDDRANFVYKRITGQAYNPNTQQNSATTQSFNVTGRVSLDEDAEQGSRSTGERRTKFLIRQSWFPGKPKPNDLFEYDGVTYTARLVEQDYQRDEWIVKTYV